MAGREAMFWENFGVGQQTRKDLNLQRAQEQFQANQINMADTKQNANWGKLGAMLGSAVGGTLAARSSGGRGFLSEKEDQLYSAKEQTAKKYKAAKNAGALDGKTIEEKELIYQDMAKDSMGMFGLSQEQYAVNKSLTAQKNAKKKQDLEFARLEQGITKGGLEIEKLESDKEIRGRYAMPTADLQFKALKREAINTVYDKGSQDPNSGQDVYVEVDGSYTDENGNRVELGDYTTIRPNRDTRASRGYRARDILTPTQSAKIRDQGKTLGMMTRASNRALQILADDAADGTVDVMGGAGTTLKVLRRAADTAGTLLNVAGQTYKVVTQDGSERPISYKQMQNSPAVQAELSKYDQIAREQGRDAAALKSIAMTLAYAKARSNEPGNTRLSDTDIANAMNEIGMGATNPETMRQIFRGNVKEARTAFEDSMSMIPSEYHGGIIAQKGLDRIQQDLDAFDDFSLDQDYGTANAPGEDLSSKARTAPKPDAPNTLNFGPESAAVTEVPSSSATPAAAASAQQQAWQDEFGG